MMKLSDFIIPAVVGFVLLYGLIKGVDVFKEFIAGAKEGFSTSVSIIPSLVALLTCVGMLKASGAIDILTSALAPLAVRIAFPKELIPLALLRPISGSGALVIFEDILKNFGPDSQIGRIASVLMGSTETTFYTIAVYFGAVGITKTRHAAVSSVTADIVGFLLSAVAVNIIFS